MRTSTLLGGVVCVVACLWVATNNFNLLGKICSGIHGEDNLNHSFSSFYDLSAVDLDGNEVSLFVYFFFMSE